MRNLLDWSEPLPIFGKKTKGRQSTRNNAMYHRKVCIVYLVWHKRPWNTQSMQERYLRWSQGMYIYPCSVMYCIRGFPWIRNLCFVWNIVNKGSCAEDKGGIILWKEYLLKEVGLNLIWIWYGIRNGLKMERILKNEVSHSRTLFSDISNKTDKKHVLEISMNIICGMFQ